MKQFLPHARRGLEVVAGNLGNFVFILLRNKMLAVYVGPLGVGWIALVNNLVEVSANLSGAGVSDALGRELARKHQSYATKDIVSTGLGMLIVSLLVVVPVVEWLFFRLAAPSGLIVLSALGFAVAAVAAGAWRYVSGIYLGLGQARTMFHVLIWGAAFNMVASVLLLLAGWRHFLAFVLLSYVPLALFSLLGLMRQMRGAISLRAIWRMPAWRPMVAIALPVLLGQPLEVALVLLLRSATSARLGNYALGQIQPGLQFVILGASLFNAFAGITTSRWDQSNERGFSPRSLALVGAAVAVAVFGAMFVALTGPLWALLVRLLFTRAFLPGTVAVPWFLGGEALHLGALLLFSTFLSRSLGLLTLVPRLAGLITMIAVLHAGFDGSLVLIGQAYACTFLVYFLVTLALWCAVQAKIRHDLYRAPGVVRPR